MSQLGRLVPCWWFSSAGPLLPGSPLLPCLLPSSLPTSPHGQEVKRVFLHLSPALLSCWGGEVRLVRIFSPSQLPPTARGTALGLSWGGEFLLRCQMPLGFTMSLCGRTLLQGKERRVWWGGGCPPPQPLAITFPDQWRGSAEKGDLPVPAR